ncbi:MAG: hypothetical protein HKN31_13800 [Pricia sp.]|nr:hypothetical protein [Pricia sp.]
MNINLLIILFLSLPLLSFCQENEQKESYFIALYTVGENWDSTKQPGEQTYFKEHSAHLNQLRKDSTIAMGARYDDTGMILIKATDLDSAKGILQNDLAIENKLFNLEIHSFSPFYKGCLE